MIWDDHKVEENNAGTQGHPAQAYLLKTIGATPAFWVVAQRALMAVRGQQVQFAPTRLAGIDDGRRRGDARRQRPARDHVGPRCRLLGRLST